MSLVRIGNKEYEVADGPAMERRDLLRGEFAMVEYTIEGRREVRLVLCGLAPENRKVVLMSQADDQIPLDWLVVQDSPGMARTGGAE